MPKYHVVKNPKGGWNIKKEKSDRSSGTAKTQKQAENKAKDLARKNGGGEVFIHSPKGPIRDRDTVPPASDPYPPEDKKH